MSPTQHPFFFIFIHVPLFYVYLMPFISSLSTLFLFYDSFFVYIYGLLFLKNKECHRECIRSRG